jgi:hypothetical protein
MSASSLRKSILDTVVHKALEHAGGVPGVGLGATLIAYFSADEATPETLAQIVPYVVFALLLNFLGGLLIDPLIAKPLLDRKEDLARWQRWVRARLAHRIAQHVLRRRLEGARAECAAALGLASEHQLYGLSEQTLKTLDEWDAHKLWNELSKTARMLMLLPVTAELLSRLGMCASFSASLFRRLPALASWCSVPLWLGAYVFLRAEHMRQLYAAVAKTKGTWVPLASQDAFPKTWLLVVRGHAVRVDGLDGEALRMQENGSHHPDADLKRTG